MRPLRALLCLSLALLPACKRFERKHIPVDHLAELGYPSCGGRIPDAGELLTEQHLRSGPAHIDQHIVERYSVRRRDCIVSLHARQEWPLGTVDFEVVYDSALTPLRVWKRMTVPSLANAGAKAEIRRYELRTEPVGIKWRSPTGKVSYEQLKGGKPAAVVGPGRGVISMWLRRARLQPGQKVRELVLDVRALEKIEPVTLMREPDMAHPELGKVRVYTFYGRESVFADQQDNVIGDLAGLRPHRLLKTQPPPAIPLFGVIDPVNSP